MSNRWLIALATIFALSFVVYAALVIANIASADALLGFLGVIVGGTIVEASRHFATEEVFHNQLRLAALDRRLQAHQEAYSLWRQMIANVGQGQKTTDVVMHCQAWWNDNCLYLNAQARESFLRAFHALADHSTFVAIHAEAELLMRTMDEVISAGDVIIKGVELPSLGEIERKPIKP